MNYIYRDFNMTLSQKNCSQLLQALAISRGTIVSNFTLNNGFPEKTVGRWEMFFKLRFSNETELEKFHSFGFATKEPEQVVGV
jgi:hypothetical protein